MGRPPDPRRRASLLAGAAAHLEAHGLAGFSLRPVAAALGTSPRVLLYHFGSKDRLLAEALADIVDRFGSPADADANGDRRSVPERARLVWRRLTAPEARDLLRLYVETSTAALREPERYEPFLKQVVHGLPARVAAALEADGLSAEQASDDATDLVALHQGLVVDLLATGDRARVDAAHERAVGRLEDELRRAGRPRLLGTWGRRRGPAASGG